MAVRGGKLYAAKVLYPIDRASPEEYEDIIVYSDYSGENITEETIWRDPDGDLCSEEEAQQAFWHNEAEEVTNTRSLGEKLLSQIISSGWNGNEPLFRLSKVEGVEESLQYLTYSIFMEDPCWYMDFYNWKKVDLDDLEPEDEDKDEKERDEL